MPWPTPLHRRAWHMWGTPTLSTAVSPCWAEALENCMTMRNPWLLLPTLQAAPTATHHFSKPSSQRDQISLTHTVGGSPLATGNSFAAVHPMATSRQTWPCALATKAAGPTRTTHALGVRPAGTHTWHLLQNPFSSQKVWASGLGPSAEVGLARGNHAKQKSSTLKQPLKCPVQPRDRRCAPAGVPVCKCA